MPGRSEFGTHRGCVPSGLPSESGLCLGSWLSFSLELACGDLQVVTLRHVPQRSGREWFYLLLEFSIDALTSTRMPQISAPRDTTLKCYLSSSHLSSTICHLSIHTHIHICLICCQVQYYIYGSFKNNIPQIFILKYIFEIFQNE